MKKTTKNTGIKVNTNVKAAGVPYMNHTRTGLKVKTALRGGTSILYRNHNLLRVSLPTTKTTTERSSGIKVSSAVKAGGVPYLNHTRTGLKVKTALRGGTSILYRNHSAVRLSLS